jgi:hypothetical protein
MSKQLTTLQDRLSAWTDKVREQAEAIEPGPGKDALLRKVGQAEKASELDNWVISPGLRRPK